ncbi:MAG: ATP-binding protein [Candidatus Thorarchaeota archaeon]|nr:ATP-binding protein [Candidatus Thorarchaeota archaeon]
MTSILEGITTTADITLSNDPLERVIGQQHAVSLVQSAVVQRRHILLCGAPGIGKSMLARAAYSLLPPPKDEVWLQRNVSKPDRPLVRVTLIEDESNTDETPKEEIDLTYIRPETLPFEIAAKMGYRCPACGAFSHPSQSVCMDCQGPKRLDWSETASYHGLLRELSVISEPAQTSVTRIEGTYKLTYRRTFDDTIMVLHEREFDTIAKPTTVENDDYRVLVSRDSSRFVHVSGSSPVELLGDVKHDPYGSAESLGMAAHLRVVPGAIHEAHEGILYVDEIASLGEYQKHLLTAMQDRKYSISGRNPNSSGAAVRTDDIPCDFLLFAACNVEDLPGIIPPLRSRIRGYGYEIMLNSTIPKSDQNIHDLVRFTAQTVEEDGRIPHLTADAIESVLQVAEDMAFRLDGQRNSFTLRLRELGGLVRIAGDLAVQDYEDLILPKHVLKAESLSRGIGNGDGTSPYPNRSREISKPPGDYFF